MQACKKLPIAWILTALLGMFAAPQVLAGPYSEPGIDNDDPAIAAWASAYSNVVRGPMDIADPGGGNASLGTPDDVLGPATCSVYDVMSLGDGGQVTLSFGAPVYDGPGDDLVVFENGFISGDGMFAELAFVEVSTDGVTFARLPSVSLTPDPVGGFGNIDPTDVFSLAGKHPGGNQAPCEGTGFDLADLAGDPLVTSGTVDLNAIQYVKVVDVIGDGSTQDSQGNPVHDPYPTILSAGGFDLQAVGALNLLDCTDGDGDGYSPDAGACGPVDCDDGDAAIHPGVLEGPPGDPTCSDGVDNNCNGVQDAGDPGCQDAPAWSAAEPVDAAVIGGSTRLRSAHVNVLLLLVVPAAVLVVRRIRRHSR